VQLCALGPCALEPCALAPTGGLKGSAPSSRGAPQQQGTDGTWRTPAGESYLDVIQRLEPVIIEVGGPVGQRGTRGVTQAWSPLRWGGLWGSEAPGGSLRPVMGQLVPACRPAHAGVAAEMGEHAAGGPAPGVSQQPSRVPPGETLQPRPCAAAALRADGARAGERVRGGAPGGAARAVRLLPGDSAEPSALP